MHFVVVDVKAKTKVISATLHQELVELVLSEFVKISVAL